MKVEILQSDLIECLKVVSRAVSGQNALPVLSNILVRAEGKKMHFSATNLEISISTSCDGDVKNEGAITIPHKILTPYISLIDREEKIELSVSSGATLEIKSKESKTKIKGISAEEFPTISPVEGGEKWEISSEDFRQSVAEVAFAAQENSSRPILSGVLLAAKKDALQIAATDSYRLSEKKIRPKTPLGEKSAVIPVRAIFEADRLAGADETVRITVSENQAMFSLKNTQLITRLIEGQFPDYHQIIPKKSSASAEVSRADFERAVRRVSIFAKENNQHMKLEFLSDQTLTVSTQESEIGEEKTTLPIKFSGEVSVIALNADYVSEVLSALAAEEKIRIELEGKMSPAVFKKVKSEDFVHLIMPLKI